MKKHAGLKLHNPLPMLRNEEGSILVISLLVLTVLALLGGVASKMSVLEMKVAANEKRYNQSFYVADGAWQEVPVHITNEIHNARDPSTLDVTILAGDKYLNNIKYDLNVVRTGDTRKMSGCGKNCIGIIYNVNASTYVGNTTDKTQQIDVTLAAPFNNIGYGN